MRASSITKTISLFAIIFVFNMGAYAVPSLKQEKNNAPIDYWKSTGLSLFTVDNQYLKYCYDSQEYFAGCVAIISGAAESLSQPAVFATDEEVIAQSALVGEKLADYDGPGGLNLYRVKISANLENVDYVTQLKKAKLDRQIQSNALAALYNRTKNNRNLQFDFAMTLDVLRYKILTGELADREAQFAGYLINRFLEVAVDPHTRIAPTTEVMAQRKDAENYNSFVGIGVQYRLQKGYMLILEVIEGGGAEAAGMKANDLVVAVDGVALTEDNATATVKSILGEENTKIKLSIKRADNTFDLIITRKKIITHTVTAELVNHIGEVYGLIKLKNFMDEEAANKLRAAIDTVTAQGAKGLILDLRGNGGGLITQAQEIGSLFVGKKLIVSVKPFENASPEILNIFKNPDYIGAEKEITHLPMVTLIDGGSASASEILSGALQDYHRSWILGDRSFGKGSVQGPSYRRSGLLTYYSTIARFYLPSGRTNQIVGVLPDFSVDPFPGASANDKFAAREEDLYANALPPMNSAWAQTRPKEVKKIELCKSDKLAKEIFDAGKNAGNPIDYRVLVAEQVLKCAK